MNTIHASYQSARAAGWPLERVLFTLAGTVIVGSVVLAHLASPWFGALTLFVGLNQLMYAAIGMCPLSVVLARALRLPSVLYTQGATPSAPRSRSTTGAAGCPAGGGRSGRVPSGPCAPPS